MKKYLGLALGASIVVLTQSCSSDSGSKKARVNFDAGAAGGEAGASGESGNGGTTSRGGTGGSGTSGSGAVAGSANDGVSGEGGATGAAAGDSGTTSSAAGEGGSATTCAPGFADCDTDPSTCETDLSLLTSCGSCNTSCNGSNDTVVCEDLKCKITSCNAGFDDCNKSAADGCEQSLAANDNCGECARNCGTYGSTCSNSLCTPLVVNPKLSFGSDSGGLNNWAISGTNIYEAGYAFPYTITRIPIDGSAISTVWTNSSHYIGHQSLITTATSILWAERSTPTSTVFQKALTDPAATNPTLVFTPEYQPTFMHIQGNAYFWMTGDYQAGEPSYVYTRGVSAVATDPGARIVTVSQGTNGDVVSFQTSSDALYWVTGNAGTGTAYELRTTPLAGGTPTAVPAILGAANGTAISDGGAASAVQLQTLGKTVYFNYHVGTSSQNGIYSFNVGDAAPKVVVLDGNVRFFQVDATGVYYAGPNDQGVLKAPLTGGAGAAISTATFYGGSTGGIATMDNTFVYTYGIPLGGASTCCSIELYKLLK